MTPSTYYRTYIYFPILDILVNDIKREIHKLIISIWNKEEMPDQWKESIIVPVYKKGDKTDCSNCRSISLLSTTHKILSNILLSRLLFGVEVNQTNPVTVLGFEWKQKHL
jgi:hypothetical protein